MKLDKEEIKKHLPHRDPFMFVDAVDDFDQTQIRARLRLKADLPFFEGHFPEKPIMPGVLITESLAQTSGLIISLSEKSDGGIFYLASANIKFVEPVFPPAELVLNSRLDRAFNGLFQFAVEASAEGRTAARGTIVLATPKK